MVELEGTEKSPNNRLGERKSCGLATANPDWGERRDRYAIYVINLDYFHARVELDAASVSASRGGRLMAVLSH